MSKKKTYPPQLVKVADKAGDELSFPADRHVLTPAQREVPNPAAALAAMDQPQLSERARLRAATAIQDQRDARARREVQQIIAAAERPAPTVREDLQAVRRRPLDAPMATPTLRLPQPPAPMVVGGARGIPDPMATIAWEAVVADVRQTARTWWGKWSLTAALALWSAGCFLLGKLT